MRSGVLLLHTTLLASKLSLFHVSDLNSNGEEFGEGKPPWNIKDQEQRMRYQVQQQEATDNHGPKEGKGYPTPSKGWNYGGGSHLVAMDLQTQLLSKTQP